MTASVNAPAPEAAAIPENNSISDGERTLTGSPDQSGTVQDGIEYRYLTFESDIPTSPVLPPGTSVELPPCPDLQQYGNPFEWSPLRKNLITWLSCSVNGVAAYASGAYASPEAQLREKWGVSHTVYTLGISLFTWGFGIAPMILAPLSEVNGRRPVFVVSGIVFFAMQIGCALTPTFPGMLICRFIAGLGGSTFSTMSGGILADIWVTKERNTAMVIFTGATIFGTGLGPLISGVAAQRLLWRWVFYIQVIIAGILVFLVTFFFKETRGSIILSQKAKALNKWYEQLEALGVTGMQALPTDPEKPPAATSCPPHPIRLRFRVLADEQRASLSKMIAISLYRPIHMLFTEPVVFFFSLWISFAWAILYLQFGSVPLVFRVSYGFTLEQTGYIFTAMCVGAILSTWLSIWQEKFMNRYFPARMASPEGRMFGVCIEAVFLPISLFWFGWTCFPTIHWILPALSIGLATMGIFAIFLAMYNYCADAYHTYTSSALAATGLCRNLVGGAFPLVTQTLFNDLGFQAASSLLGGIAAVLTLVPFVLVWKGPQIRARSRIARQFVDKPE